MTLYRSETTAGGPSYGKAEASYGYLNAFRDRLGSRSIYRYTVQYWQNDLGMYWYNSRWYDQLTGRFLQPDTIVPEPGDPMSLNRYLYVRGNPIRYTDPSGHFTEDELLEWDVFFGPNQLNGVRDETATSFWYYILRAAEFGDKLSFAVYGSDRIVGEFVLEDGALQFSSDGGPKYRVAWEGFRMGESAISQFLPQQWTLTKDDDQIFRTEQQLRTYVNGPSSLTDPDYYELSIGGYFGVGGNVSIKHDRFGKSHFGVQGGVGFGRWGGSFMAGKLLQSATADPGQIALAVDGWGASFQGGYWVGGALPIVNSGPQPVQFGFSSPGFAMAGGYTWQIP